MATQSSTGERRRRGLLSKFAKPGRASVLGTVALAMIATLVNPIGVQSASAADGNPTFWIGRGDARQARDDYWGFINHIRSFADQGRDRSVAGTSTPVDHTDSASQGYFQVDIHAWDSNPNDYVRLQIRAADLYLVGWWSSDNYYNRVDDTRAPTARWQDGGLREAAGDRTPSFHGDYPSLQNAAGVARRDLHFNPGALNDSVWALLNAHNHRDNESGAQRGQNTRDQALAVMRFAQFVSEATRFRSYSDYMATAVVPGGDVVLPDQIIDLPNQWDALSQRFNQLRNEHRDDRNPLTVWARNENGGVQQYVLWTLALYANYVLNTAKGF